MNAEKLKFEPAPDCAGSISDKNGMSVAIEDDGAILYKRESKPLAVRVMDLYNSVQEYMSAYQNAPPETLRPGGWEDSTRTLLSYNNIELAAGQYSDGSMEFITWRLDRNGDRENGHYYSDYNMAKQDFAVRAELINRDMLFSEKELAVIRSFLSGFMALENNAATYSQEETAKEVLRKIDDVITPEIQENTQEATEMGFEPESEL